MGLIIDPWQNYWAWRVGKIKVFWFFGPVEDSSGEQMMVRKRQQTTGKATNDGKGNKRKRQHR